MPTTKTTTKSMADCKYITKPSKNKKLMDETPFLALFLL